MIIINTTDHASDNIKEIFINWIKEIYIPTALQHEELSEPQLCRIITGNENEGENFSLQFHVKDTASLSRWYNETGDDLAHALTEKFKDQVVGFTTLLEIIE